MALARYTFLPWLRRGAANAIASPAAVASRATVDVSLAVDDGSATGAAIPKTFALMGPGDIAGIGADVVIRTEPSALVADFEPNYLAFIEFYDEDFCWRHTPARPDAATHRLIPWITLLVLADAEFDRNQTPGRPLTSVAIKASEAGRYFPPIDQAWAWAHAQIAASLGDGPVPDAARLATTLSQAPDKGVSRLVCPRRLRPNTAYSAFVVPTFEVGRKAGLGLAIDDSSEPGLTMSWAAGALEYPIYYEWSFRTGEGGDFEDLVQRMQARPVDERVGVRDMDIAAPGFGMPVVAEAVGPNHHAGVVGLEGALKSPAMAPKRLDPVSTFPADVARIVNAPAVAQADAANEDPVVAPPLMGGWHALLNRVDPDGAGSWVNDLNVDPRSRAAGGLGGRVIRTNQERYMKLAWDQVGEVLAANRRASGFRFAQSAAQKLFVRNIAPLPPEAALMLTAPVFARVLGSPKTIRGLVGASRMPDAAISPAFRKLSRPRGVAMQRALPLPLRPAAAGRLATAANEQRASAAPPPPPVTGPTIEAMADRVAASYADLPRTVRIARWTVAALLVLALVVAVIATGALAVIVVAGALAAAAAVFIRLQRVQRLMASVERLDLSALTPSTVAAEPAAGFALTHPGGTAVATTDAAAAVDFAEAQRAFAALLSARPAPRADRPAFDISNAHAEVLAALAPSAAYPRRAAQVIRIGDRSIIEYTRDVYPTPAVPPNEPTIGQVMAYPDIKDPMYEPLAAMSDDLLVPNIGLVAPNTISLMLINQPFIEAYMAGLNHEFSRELLWREYPTDSRGSPFRQFWNADAAETPGLDGPARAAALKDIEPLHKWGTSTPLGAHANPGRGVPADRVVLVVRGDLLKRYPRTIVYAQRARWSDDPHHPAELVLFDEQGEKVLTGIADPNIAYPMFSASISPDLNFIGFDLALDEVRGAPGLDETADARAGIAADRLGWFFVLQEVLAEPRLGLDEHSPAPGSESDFKWDNFSWANLDMSSRELIDLAAPLASDPAGSVPSDRTLIWSMPGGATAADVAGILNQKPVLVAWHARQMLERGKVDEV